MPNYNVALDQDYARIEGQTERPRLMFQIPFDPPMLPRRDVGWHGFDKAARKKRNKVAKKARRKNRK